MRLRSSRRNSSRPDFDDKVVKKKSKHAKSKERHKIKKKKKPWEKATLKMNTFQDSSYERGGNQKSPSRDSQSNKKNKETIKIPVTIEIVDTDDEISATKESHAKEVIKEPKKPVSEPKKTVSTELSALHQEKRRITISPEGLIDKGESSQLKRKVTPDLKQPSLKDKNNYLDATSTVQELQIDSSRHYKVNPKTTICWSCMVPLEKEYVDGSPSSEEGGASPNSVWGSTFLYSIHCHPSLHIMCCSPCNDRAEQVENLVLMKQDKISKNSSSGESDDVDEQTCSMCTGESTFNSNYDENEGEINKYLGQDLICDFCPRTFCILCLSRIYGGGKGGWNTLMKILNDDKPWKCIHCEDPPLLQVMRKHLQDKASGKGDSPEENTSSKDSESQLAQLINDLNNVEDAKEYACSMLENEVKEKMVSEILTQSKTDNTAANQPTDKEVDDVYSEWSKEWEDHYHRIEDTITNLQEHMEVLGLDLDAFYKYRNSAASTSQESQESDPSWKHQADAELDKRDMESGLTKGSFKGASGYAPQDSDVMYRDLDELSELDLLEIEDINSSEASAKQLEAIAKAGPNPWRSGSCIPEKDIIRFQSRALAADNRELESLNIDPNRLEKKSISERDDAKREMTLRREASEYGLGKDMKGSRILFRALSDIHKKQKEHKKKSTSRIRRNSENKKRERIKTTSEPKQKKRINPEFVRTSNNDLETVQEISSQIFSHSDLTLQSFSVPKSDCRGGHQFKSISITAQQASKLKQHQKEGVKFIWEKVFGDLVHSPSDTKRSSKDENLSSNDNDVRGCILAHNMGLGKSLQVIAITYTLYSHPLLITNQPTKGYTLKAKISRILLVVPVNTITNWINEFKIWCDDLNLTPLACYNLNDTNSNSMARGIMIQTWVKNGGILLTSSETLARTCKFCLNEKDSNMPQSSSSPNDAVKSLYKEAFVSPGPCVVVLDEAHTMLKSNKTDISKVLYSLETRRRIALTGTPMQNSLIEYYHMANWVKPGCLGTEQSFERKFAIPIMRGMVTDCAASVLRESELLSLELTQQLSNFVQRKDNKILSSVLPPLQQAVIHVRQTKMQSKLYNAFRRYRKRTCNNNFFDQYHKLRPINNHPGCLLIRAEAENEKSGSGDTTIESKNKDKKMTVEEDAWWDDIYKKNPNMADVKNGGKVVLLLNILAHADEIGDKVVVFAQCLKTLDYIEKVLNKSNWEKLVPSLKSLSPGKTWGPWKRNFEYLRIDGSTNANERGELVRNFNDNFDTRIDNGNPFVHNKIENSKVFLISSKAGGVGINLVAANRVVIFDSHWNPAIDLQALYRCYRYGQTKHVFAYRLLAGGTMEEKVFSRSVNKSGLAARVVDSRFPERNFSAEELTNLLEIENWVQCELCDKWRMLPPGIDPIDEDAYWECSMNEFDPPRSNCTAVARDEFWYRKYFSRNQNETTSTSSDVAARDSIESVPSHDPEKDSLAKQDIILQNLLKIQSQKTRQVKTGELTDNSSSKIISQFNFHECLMRDAKKTEDEGETKVNELPIANSSSVQDVTLISNEKTRGKTKSRKSEKHPTDTNSGHSNIDLNEKAKQAFLSGRTGKKKKKKVKTEDLNPAMSSKKKTPERKKASLSNSEQMIICIDSDIEDMVL